MAWRLAYVAGRRKHRKFIPNKENGKFIVFLAYPKLELSFESPNSSVELWICMVDKVEHIAEGWYKTDEIILLSKEWPEPIIHFTDTDDYKKIEDYFFKHIKRK